MKALLLAAGYGTRLYPLTKNVPKPLLPIAGKPLVQHQIDKIETIKEISQVVVVTNHRFASHFQEWADSYAGRLTITITDDGSTTDENKLGPIGDIEFGIKQTGINEDILIIAGDNLFGFSLYDFIQFFYDKKSPILALIDLKDKSKLANKFGVAEVNGKNRVISFEEKPLKPKSTLAATACYVVRKKDLPVIKMMVANSKAPAKLNAGNLIIELMKQSPVYGFTFSEHWFDIGSQEEYKFANQFYTGG